LTRTESTRTKIKSNLIITSVERDSEAAETVVQKNRTSWKEAVAEILVDLLSGLCPSSGDCDNVATDVTTPINHIQRTTEDKPEVLQ